MHVAVRLETAGAVGRKPTRKQRGYYFAVVCQQFGEHCGTSRNETHQALKLEILGRVQPDNPFSPIKSIRTLPSPQAFVDYVDQCVAIAGRFGCELPPPDPAWRVRGYLDEWQTAVGRAA